MGVALGGMNHKTLRRNNRLRYDDRLQHDDRLQRDDRLRRDNRLQRDILPDAAEQHALFGEPECQQ